MQSMPPETRRQVLRLYVRRVRAQSLSGTVRNVLQPGVARKHLRVLLGAPMRQASNEYRQSHSPEAEISFCASLLGVPSSTVRSIRAELGDDGFDDALRNRYFDVRRNARAFDLGRFRIWYTVARVLLPNVVLETGVHDGLSSAVILQALERNGTGRLVSIDLPSTDLPPTADGPGWLVPEPLRARWTLHVGDARRLLPRVARDLSAIDVFSHDSDHSADHQAFEYEAVRPYLAPGALVLSDQDYPHETALPELARRVAGVHRRVRTVAGDPGLYAGGVRLPGGG